MYSHLVWWPEGVTLWPQTWDIPSAIFAAVLVHWISPLTAYNVAVFVTFPLSGLTCYWLAREIYGDHLAAFIAGCLYTFSSLHNASAMTNLHIASMQWSPLFLVGMVQTYRRQGGRGPFVAGIGLSLATLASLYHLMLLTAATCLCGLSVIYNGTQRPARGLPWRCLALATVFGVCAGWYLVSVILAYRATQYVGAHDPTLFSLDLQSLVIPGQVSAWSAATTKWHHWSGTEWSTAGYLGYATTGLACIGAYCRPIARACLALAGVGIVLALGPFVHVGGIAIRGLLMPYGLMDAYLPMVSFGGIPSRFVWLATLGLAMAAGAAFTTLRGRGARQYSLAVILAMLSIAELWPHSFTMTEFPRIGLMQQWSEDRRDWAVLDATDKSRALWHQTVHGHPMIGGYVTRVPESVWLRLRADPVLSALLGSATAPTVHVAVSPAAIKHRLRALSVRFVVIDEAREGQLEWIGFTEVYRADGIIIYEVTSAV